jgi:hypothetical protein
MTGGSHTNFNGAAFSVGAMSGALALGGAVAAGVANFRAAQAARYDDWTVQRLVAALRYSELMRARDQMMLGGEVNRLRVENERLRRDVVVKTARGLPRR